jgi:putative N6-adenine-specific DNA methylase
VDRANPDVGIAVHLARDVATLYLDVGGASLHERGWRSHSGPAPLRETLAAAVLRLSGWNREEPLIDPMCGAGTLAIEAAAWSRRLAPGLVRSTFGFERWANYDDAMRARMSELRSEARAAARPEGPPIRASDVDADAVECTRANARAAGVDLIIEQRDVRSLEPLHPPGFVATNPPYGQRLEVASRLYDDLARALRRMHGHTIALLAAGPAMSQAMGRSPDRWWILYNGPIECRLLVYR